jgi:hypothetical protein
MKSIEEQRAESRLIEETKILGKINAVHRLGFRDKFPQQVEHILRLISERLQLGLNKNSSDSLDNSEVADLAQALHQVYQVYKEQEHK